MRVTAGAVGGGTLGLVAAVAFGAAYPAQLVVGTAAGVGYLMLLLELVAKRRVGATDWLTVQLLLAGNLAAFAVGPAQRIGWAATTLLLAGAIALAAGALRLRFRR